MTILEIDAPVDEHRLSLSRFRDAGAVRRRSRAGHSLRAGG
jgi:hypothetical protein